MIDIDDQGRVMATQAFAQGMNGIRCAHNESPECRMEVRRDRAVLSCCSCATMSARRAGFMRDEMAATLIAHSGRPSRSEEHTSELQSLMRISYAVFCLKKTNNTNDIHTLMPST